MSSTDVAGQKGIERCAGVLLHPTSLPGAPDNGDLGHDAYRFIEFLSSSGFKVWQVLPLGPTHEDLSPYQCLSAHAGNPLLISLDWLVDRGWLDLESVALPDNDPQYRIHCLRKARERFHRNIDEQWSARLEEFRAQHAEWLEDYALFIALKQHYESQPWYQWPAGLRHREPDAMKASAEKFADEIAQVVFEQFIFFTQWRELREYAARHSVKLFGDMPIFVALDSADVWASRSNFLMNSDGEMSFVSGVPPDAFSDTGQRWGNPLYDWQQMFDDGFAWWKSRFATQLGLFDLIRIDHFRGLEACWMIPADEETAMNGHWEKSPGEALLSALLKRFPELPLVAEDLGVITDEVIALKDKFNLPGMKVLQFAFDGNSGNPHLPHQHRRNDLIYTGTHDNDTTLGWVNNEANYNRDFLESYAGCSLGSSEEERFFAMLRMALASTSSLSLLPMQDLLRLGSESRMNMPGTMRKSNWRWRFEWRQIEPGMIDRVKGYLSLYQR